jgi:hypothetical protein
MADAAASRQVIKFTDLAIKHLKPQANRYTVWSNGGNGFGLRVSPSGDRSFIYWYRFGTRKRLLTLGKYPATTLAVAAKRHADARHLVEQGKDPGELKQVAKQEFKAAPTVSELLEEYKRLELDKQTRGAEAYRMLKKDLLPALGHKKAQDVARRDVVVLLDAVRQRAPVLANRLQGRIVRMFNFAADRGVVSHNALARMSKVEEKPRERALSDAEVSRLWARLGTVGLFKVWS